MFDWFLNTHLGNFFKNPSKNTFMYKFVKKNVLITDVSLL